MSFPTTLKFVQIYNASHCTTEIPDALFSAINKPYVSIVGGIIQNNDEILYIIICPKGYVHCLPKYYITYQLDANHIFDDPYQRSIQEGAILNFDYSLKNIAYCLLSR